MKRRTFALALACALSLALLTSCGGSNSSSSVSGSGSSAPGSSSSQEGSDLSAPGTSQSDASQEEGSQSAGSAQEQTQPDASQSEASKLTLNRTEFALFTTGSSFRLKAAGAPAGTTVTWKSSDEKVATVGEDGTVTYVSAGNATITAAAGDLTATCKVYCKAQENTQAPEKPNNSGSSGGSSSDSSSNSSQSAEKDWAKLYSSAITNNGGEMVTYNPVFTKVQDGDLSGMIVETMGLNTGDMAAFGISASAMNVKAYGIAAVKPAAGKEAAVKQALQSYIDKTKSNFEQYLADQYEVASSARLETLSDGTILMVMCEDQDTVFNAISAAILAG